MYTTRERKWFEKQTVAMQCQSAVIVETQTTRKRA
jgi:hypothetical protein